jgi:hypothetical protein
MGSKIEPVTVKSISEMCAVNPRHLDVLFTTIFFSNRFEMAKEGFLRVACLL